MVVIDLSQCSKVAYRAVQVVTLANELRDRQILIKGIGKRDRGFPMDLDPICQYLSGS